MVLHCFIIHHTLINLSSFLTQVSDEGINAIANLENLTDLIICSDYKISDSAICNVIKKCKHLKRLDIGHNYLTDAALREIINDVPTNITEIRIFKCPNVSFIYNNNITNFIA